MGDGQKPSSHPFGETKYHNFDPEEVNSPTDAVEVLEWVADENAQKGNLREAEVFRDAAAMIRVALVEDDQDE